MIGERIKKLRKTLELTQQTFCERIGIKRNTIAKYETGRGDPIDAVISLICREFGVNEKWLRTGEGEMFSPEDKNELDALSQKYSLSPSDRLLIEKFLNLKPVERQVVMKYVLSVAADYSEPAAEPQIAQRTQTYVPHGDELDIEAELAAYRVELEAQKEAARMSSASAGPSTKTG